MKTLIATVFILSSYLFASAGASCNFNANVNATVTNATCFGSNNGSISISSVSGGTPFQTSNKGLLISEYLTNPSGNDSPFEFVELVATKTIDFSVTPYTVIFTNNGVATTNGWVNGGSISYAFEISTGTVQAGGVVYVGGSSMVPTGNQIRIINTVTTAGDGGIGNADGAANGVLGNGGANADGIAVFDVAAGSINNATVPIDAVFFGTGAGTSVVSGGTAGYQLPVNDMYSGGKLQSNSFIVADASTGQSTRAIGTYNVRTNTFSTTRTWVNVSYDNNNASTVNLEGLYDFSWSNGAITQNVSNLTAGIYSVTITDAAFCLSTNQFTVTQNDVAQVNLNIDNVFCYGANTGAINAVTFGGSSNPLRNYTWSSNGGNTSNIVNLPVGNYCVTVSDLDGCTATACGDVTQPDSIKIETVNIDSTSCFGGSDGLIEIQLSGGTPNYIINWSNGSFNTLQLNNLQGGTYSVTVEDDNFCTKTKTFVVSQPEEITIVNIFTTDVSCFGGTDGTKDVVLSGGTGFYTFQWNNNITSNSNFIELLPAGNYSATVTDENGCSFGFNAGPVNEPDELVATTSNVIFESCAGISADGVYAVNVNGGTTPYTYNWSNGVQGTDNFIDGLGALGSYAVTVTDDNGCTVETSTNFGFISNLNVTVDNVTDASTCALADGAINLSTTGQAGSLTYTWNNAASTQDISGLPAGTYSVTVTDGDCTVSIDNIEVECFVSVQNVLPTTYYLASLVNNQLLLKVGEANVAATVYALNGAMMYSGAINNQELTVNTTNWAEGMYLVRFTNAKGDSFIKKVVK